MSLTTRGKVIIAAGTLVVLTSAIAAAKWSYEPELMARADALYEGTVGHHVAKGEGLTTNLMPLGGLRIALDSGHGTADPWPSLHKFALSQIRVGAFFAVLGHTVRALRLSSLVPYLFLLVALFLVLRRVLGGIGFPLGFTLLFLAFDLLSDLALSGLTYTTDTLLFLLAVVAWHRALKGHLREGLVCGLALAALVLHRYSFVLLVPLVAATVWRCAGWRSLLAFTTTSVVPLSAFCLRSLVRFHVVFPSYLGGSLFLHRTSHLPYDPWYVQNWPPLAKAIVQDPGLLAAKWRASASLLSSVMFPSVWSTIQVLVMAVGVIWGLIVLWRRADRPGRVLIAAVGGWVAFFTPFHLLLSGWPVYHIYALPICWLLFVVGLHDAALRAGTSIRPLWRSATIGAVAVTSLVLVVVPELTRAAEMREACLVHHCDADGDCIDNSGILSFLRRTYPSRGLTVAGGLFPWDLAFWSEHRFTPLPESPDEVAVLARRGMRYDLIVLPAQLEFWGDGERPPEWTKWGKILEAGGKGLPGYHPKRQFRDRTLLLERDGLKR